MEAICSQGGSGDPKLLRYVGPARRAPGGGASASGAACATKALTTRIVPHGADSLREYCGGCSFGDMDRCSFCNASKLSTAHRLQMERLTSLLLLSRPNTTGRDLGRALAHYARSDSYATLLNERLGRDPRGDQTSRPHVQRPRTRMDLRTKRLGTLRSRREGTSRPTIRRLDVDLTEVESCQVWSV